MKLNQKGFSIVEVLLAVIAVTLIAGVGFFVYSNQKNDDKNNEQPKTSTSDTQNQEEVDPSAEPFLELIDYGEEGISIRKENDVEKLKDASGEFKSFIISELAELKKTTEGCIAIVGVQKVYRDSFAKGSVGSEGHDVNCGLGARAIWVKKDNKWSIVRELGGHDTPLCSTVKKYGVPESIVSECQDENNKYKMIKNPN